MDEIYVTYVDDEHVDNHDYDNNTDDDHDTNNDVNVRAFDERVNDSIYIYIYIYMFSLEITWKFPLGRSLPPWSGLMPKNLVWSSLKKY